jgi:hypothetical protein
MRIGAAPSPQFARARTLLQSGYARAPALVIALGAFVVLPAIALVSWLVQAAAGRRTRRAAIRAAKMRADAMPAEATAEPELLGAQASEPDHKTFVVENGTRIPLSMVNSVSTKTSGEGDRVYLETSFPIAVNGKIVIPAGSYVLGTVMASKRPGKVKGRGEFRLRFDSLMLPNGVTRDFRAQVAGLDGRATEDLDKKEGVIRSEGNKSGDARVIAETATTGAAVGGLAFGDGDFEPRANRFFRHRLMRPQRNEYI